jgi:hypothetical protein
MRVLSAVALSVCTVGATAEGRASEPRGALEPLGPPMDEPRAGPAPHISRWERPTWDLSALLGVGMPLDADVSLGPSAALIGTWRPVSLFALGLEGKFAWFAWDTHDASDPTPSITVYELTLPMRLYAPLDADFDGHLQLAPGLFHGETSLGTNGGCALNDGVELGIAVGLERALSPIYRMGGEFEYTLAGSVGGCSYGYGGPPSIPPDLVPAFAFRITGTVGG